MGNSDVFRGTKGGRVGPTKQQLLITYSRESLSCSFHTI